MGRFDNGGASISSDDDFDAFCSQMDSLESDSIAKEIELNELICKLELKLIEANKRRYKYKGKALELMCSCICAENKCENGFIAPCDCAYYCDRDFCPSCIEAVEA